MSAATPTVLPEQFGHYRIVERIGEGGMGSVYLARDTVSNRMVALKVAHHPAGGKSQVLQRLQREASALSTLNHPNLCPVFDVGVIDNIHFIAMAHIEGVTLAEWHKNSRPRPQMEAAALVAKLALAMHEAHKAGIIHRDLKPANIKINERNEPVILDFGLARRMDGRQAKLTQTGAILGTPSYMSPEQVLGQSQAIGPACDVYSLGVILYELLTGRLPFDAEEVMTLLLRITQDPPPPPSKYRPDLDKRLEAICLTALGKKPEQRYASMEHFTRALQQVARSEKPTVEVRPAVASTSPRTVTAKRPGAPAKPRLAPASPSRAETWSDLAATTRAVRKGRGNRRWVIAAGALVGVVALIVAAVLIAGLIEPGKPPRPNPTPAEKRLVGGSGFFSPTILVQSFYSALSSAAWVKQVWDMPADKQVEAVIAKLKERNPGFDGKLTHKIEDGVVTELRFVTDAVTDISPVGALTGLRTLNCRSTPGKGRFADLSPLKGMKLRQLFCSFTQVSDLSPLRGMPLTVLICQNTLVEDLAPLKGMPLTQLGFWGTKVADPSPLKEMPMLQDLYYEFNEKRDAEILRSIKTLQKINGKPVQDFWKETDAKSSPPDGGMKQRTPLDRLEPAKIPANQRFPWQPKELVAVIGQHQFEQNKSEINGVSLSPDGRWLASTRRQENVVKVWDLTTDLKQPAAQVELRGFFGRHVFPPKADVLVCSSSGSKTIKFWDPSTQKIRGELMTGSSAFAVTPDGQILAAPDGDNIKLWDVKTAKSRVLPTKAKNGVLAFSPDGKTLAVGGEYDPSRDALLIDLWDVDTTQKKKTVEAPNDGPSKGKKPSLGINQLVFSPDGSLVARSAFDGGIRLLRLADGKHLRSLFGHGAVVFALSFAVDGKSLFSAGKMPRIENVGPLPGGVILWDCSTGQKLRQWDFPWDVRGLALSADGRHLATANADSTVYILRLTEYADKKDEKPAEGKLAPLDDAWLKQVAAMPAEKQVEAVADELKKRNPGFDGKVTPNIEGGVVTWLQFRADTVTDISPVRALTRLTLLGCSGTPGKGQLRDISPLKGMNLTSLHCENTLLSDLSPLKGMPLTQLILSGGNVSDLSPLKGMPLTYLYFRDTKVTDVSLVKYMEKLTSLHCDGTKVSDLSPLKGMTLTSLTCQNTAVSDLSPLKGMPLTQLAFGGTQVSDLSPLRDMKLTFLHCNATRVSDLSVLKEMPLRQLRCDFSAKRDVEILRSIKTLEWINGKRAQISGRKWTPSPIRRPSPIRSISSSARGHLN